MTGSSPHSGERPLGRAGDPVHNSPAGITPSVASADKPSSTASASIRLPRPTIPIVPTLARAPISTGPSRSRPRSTELVAIIALSLMTASSPIVTRSGASITPRPMKARAPTLAPSSR